MFNGEIGRETLRRALERAAYDSRAEAHDVLKEEFAQFLKDTDLTDKEEWYLHVVRKVIQTLLANPSCTTGAIELAAILKQVSASIPLSSGSFIMSLAWSFWPCSPLNHFGSRRPD